MCVYVISQQFWNDIEYFTYLESGCLKSLLERQNESECKISSCLMNCNVTKAIGKVVAWIESRKKFSKAKNLLLFT